MKIRNLNTALVLSSLIVFGACSKDDETPVNTPDYEDKTVIEDSEPSPIKLSKGFYVANEDWFGHDYGTVNYFYSNDSIMYRVYRSANPDETLGTTTQFATIYGDNVYFMSKQDNRLVVADPQTMKKKAVFKEIGGDGRSFLGISPDKGYIGTSKGVTTFNIKDLSTGNAIEGISGQTGNMARIAGRAFILVQSKGVYAVNTSNDKIDSLLAGSFNCLTQSKDGNLWIGTGANLIKVNPYSMESETIDVSAASISGSWGAWNAGSLCASTQQNVLYWTVKNTVVKYDIDNKTLNTAFYTLGKDKDGEQLAFYGAALRVNPLTDKLVLIVKRSGWGDSGSYNWIHILADNGTLEKEIIVKGDNGLGSGWGTGDDRYFWFPTIPFFEDVHAPEILLNQIIVKPNERKAICLNDKIFDADNMSAAMIKSLPSHTTAGLFAEELKQDSLIITSFSKPGSDKLKLNVNSNGKTVEKEIRIDVRE